MSVGTVLPARVPTIPGFAEGVPVRNDKAPNHQGFVL
jgi:hypothetical protein